MRVVTTVCAVVAALAIAAAAGVYVMTTQRNAERQERKRQVAIERCVNDAQDGFGWTTKDGQYLHVDAWESEAKSRKKCERINP